MAGELLTRGPVQLTVEDADCKGGLAIALTQTRLGADLLTSRYRVEVRAKTDDGMFIVGAFSTAPPDATSPTTRVVAMASCPGALAWVLYVRPYNLDAEDPDDFGDVSGSINAFAGEPGGQLPGVVRVSERPKYYAGTAAGAVAIPPGERVTSWTAYSTGAGATVTYGPPGAPGATIPIPPAGGLSGGGSGAVEEGPLVFTFAGANFGGYLIETLESA